MAGGESGRQESKVCMEKMIGPEGLVGMFCSLWPSEDDCLEKEILRMTD